MNAPLAEQGARVEPEVVVLTERVTVHVGHVLDALARLEAGTFHVVATSPPYLWARDYGGEPVDWPAVEYRPMPGLPPVAVPAMRCALGSEDTPEAFVGHLVLVFRELWRVLRDDGTAWLDLGDSYASGGRGGGGSYARERRAWRLQARRRRGWRGPPQGLKDKDLIGVPWRVAFALQADGWWLRSDVIWAKPNPMPESIEDRPTKSKEYVFLLAKSDRYLYDFDALREPAADPRRRSRAEGRSAFRGQASLRPRGAKRSPLRAGHGRAGADGLGARSFPNWQAPAGRSKRDVWTIATQPYHGGHFATMPPALAELLVRAGTSAGGCCAVCGAPWERLVEVRGVSSSDLERERGTAGYAAAYAHYGRPKQALNHRGRHGDHVRVRVTHGWAAPWCGHPPRDPAPCRVLDPFGGSGTTGAVAHVLGRDAVLIDAQREYLPLMRRRIADAIEDAARTPRRERARPAPPPPPEQLPLPIGAPT